MSRFFLRELYSDKIGYMKKPRVSAAPLPPPVMLPIANGTAEPSDRSAPAPTQPLRSHSNYLNAVPIASAPPGFHSAPVKAESVAPGAHMGYSPSSLNAQTMQVNGIKSPSMVPATDSVDTRKRRNDDTTTMTVAFKRKATQDLAGSSCATDEASTDNIAVRPCYYLVALVHFVALILMQSLCCIDFSRQNRYPGIWGWESERRRNFAS
jgi:hypothetical protein